MTSALQIADYIRSRCDLHGEVQLQKLLYYSQAWNLAWTGHPLFPDEIQAWAMGPVVPQVWAHAKYGPVSQSHSEIGDSVKAVVDAVCNFYAPSTGSELSALSHSEEPWLEARGDTPEGERSSTPVSQSAMRRFYTRQSLRHEAGPRRPVRSKTASDTEARCAGRDQQARWRKALDALAEV